MCTYRAIDKALKFGDGDLLNHLRIFYIYGRPSSKVDATEIISCYMDAAQIYNIVLAYPTTGSLYLS